MSESERAFREWFHGMFCCDSECLCVTNEYPALKESWQAAIAYSTEREQERLEAKARKYENESVEHDKAQNFEDVDYCIVSALALREAAKGVGE